MTQPAQGGQPAAEVPSGPSLGERLRRPAQVIIISSVMFTFISSWRTAAVVLCDLASTVYYIGGVVEASIGPSAPWFILGVMVFSYFVRMVYIESCSLFVRGGVYKVVKEAMGGFLAKLSVSALMFDYVLTGPTSGVSAGQYVMGLVIQFLGLILPEATFKGLALDQQDPGQTGEAVQRWGSVLLAVLVTLYFFRQNLRGIHESSDKAMKIMWATTAMAAILLVWCLVSLVVMGPAQGVPLHPDLNPKYEHVQLKPNDGETLEQFRQRLRERGIDPRRFTETELTAGINVQDLSRPSHLAPEVDDQGQPVLKNTDSVQEINDTFGTKFFKPDDPLGFLAYFKWASALRVIGVLGLFIAFGHSILAMSGEETLAQVYREVEAPKLPNFKKAAFIVFVYSLMLTAGISFLAVLLIPDGVRMKFYSGNLIGGLARHVIGPEWLKLVLETFVVSVGFLILAGAVNTAIIGSNGVLNRIAEDGVLPDWFLKPHPKYGTTYRLLYLITGMQILVIVGSMGHVILLGEAYAFGVVWSFVFKALSMVVLRFTHREPREYKVPLNIRFGTVDFPVGLSLIFLVLLITAILNFFTKEVATIGGLAFTTGFVTVFIVSERVHEARRRKAGAAGHHQHIEQFNRATTGEISPASLGLTRPFRKLVSIRSTLNLFMLEKALAETDPDTTDMVVMTAKMAPPGDSVRVSDAADLDSYDQQLMTAVVDRAEKAGKQVKPLIVPTNNPLHAILNTAKDLQVQELVMGASNKYTVDEQLEQIAFYWINLHGGNPAPLTVRIRTRERDMALDLGGGSRIPRISERRARSVAELRAAGVGVDRVLLAHDGSPAHSDLFQAVLTMLDPEVVLALLPLRGDDGPLNFTTLHQDQERARQIGRDLPVLHLNKGDGAEIVEKATEGQYDLIILPLHAESASDPIGQMDERARYVVRHAHCRVLLAVAPAIPTEVVDSTPSFG